MPGTKDRPENGERIVLPVRAVDIFRILSVRKVVTNDAFVGALSRQFETFLRQVRQTPRLDKSNRDDFLSYTHPHESKQITKRRKNMSEQELCSASKGFMGSVGKNSPIGRVLDYQVPLEERRGTGEGKVDLISLKGDTIYVIEAKKWDSKEHPLRAMLEALTFWLELIDEDENENGNLRSQQLQCKKPLRGNARLFAQRYCESAYANPAFGEADAKFLRNACLKPAILLRKNSPIYDTLCERPTRPDRALYDQILDFVRCFSYSAKENESQVTIEEFFPKKIWGNTPGSAV
ncbi:MAG: hypothetical protein J6Y56_03945 [Fibrobacterales bacterium]|nr:hypothetical protein [Fibrobacterales bacterium]